MKSKVWDRMVSMPLAWMYCRSLSVNLKRDRNFDCFRAVSAVVIWSVMLWPFSEPHPVNQPISGVPDADAQRQHDSWSAQGRLFEFPGKDSNCQDAE
jgi:hypothetical protein